jgi:hypothetical protein
MGARFALARQQGLTEEPVAELSNFETSRKLYQTFDGLSLMQISLVPREIPHNSPRVIETLEGLMKYQPLLQTDRETSD